MSSELQYIYNLLIKGGSVEVIFKDENSAAAFRSALAVYKNRRDKTLLSIGILEEEELERTAFRKSSTALPELHGSCVFEVLFNSDETEVETEFSILTEAAKGLS